MNHTEIRPVKIPEQLLSGFLEFAKEVIRKSVERGIKFTEEQLTEIFNNSFSGKVRAIFFLHIGDINRILEGIQLIYDDLSELKKNRDAFKGNPVIRSELLFQSFFNEFFRIRELSKIFIKVLCKSEVLDKRNKEIITDSYFEAFEGVYEIRNNFVHNGLSFKDRDITLDYSVLEKFFPEEKENFSSLLNWENTREGTIALQCAIYMKFIGEIIEQYITFQEMLNGVLADLIILYEKQFQVDIEVDI